MKISKKRSQVRSALRRGVRYVLNVLEDPGPAVCHNCTHFDLDGARHVFAGEDAFAQASRHLGPIDLIRSAAVESVPQAPPPPEGEAPEARTARKAARRALLDAAADKAEQAFRTMAGTDLGWEAFGACKLVQEAVHKGHTCSEYRRPQ